MLTRGVRLVVVAAALTLVPTATAKDGFAFDRVTARPGDQIVLTSSWASNPSGVVVYLMPLADSPKWWDTYSGWRPNYGRPPALKSAIRLGRTARWRGHGAQLAFRVPRVRPARYVLGFWCVPCGTHWASALPNFQPSPRGILRVTR
jgi:hypothetical protein